MCAQDASSRSQSGISGRLRKLAGRRALLFSIFLSLTVVLSLVGWGVARRVRRGVEAARARVSAGGVVRFERRRLEPLRRAGVRVYQSRRATRSLARFHEAYFAATSGGLQMLSADGEMLRHYSVLDGLTDSDLTSVAEYGGRLYVGTRTRGLLVFDGEHFESYTWPELKAQTVTALASDEGRLLVGTSAGGLMEFDGKLFREVRADGQRLLNVTCLVRAGARLYVGTFADGLWVSEGGRWRHFTAADGLRSARVVGVVESGGDVLVATDFALVSAASANLLSETQRPTGGLFRELKVIPSLSGIVRFRGRVVLCQDDGATALWPPPDNSARDGRTRPLHWTRPAVEQSEARLVTLDDALWLLASHGSFRADELTDERARAAASVSFREFGRDEARDVPTSNLISALAFDAEGNLWAGSFRNGIDLFAPSGARRAHLETEAIREINALIPDARRREMLAATAQGLVRFDASLRAERLTMAEGLAGNSVLHAALAAVARPEAKQDNFAQRAGGDGGDGAQMFVATSRGLTFGTPDRLRTLTTVQGLPSNSVYALWSRQDGQTIYAGTLGGLVEVGSSGRVVRVFKDANSGLTHNWVTGICEAAGRLFVGTYGGGIFELMPSGDLRSFADETGKIFVNPNAMWTDGERLYAGTLDGAWVYELDTQRWLHLRDELPASVVLSVAGREGQVYFGTTAGLARIESGYFKSVN